jgi:hypothetical protein
MASIPKQSSCSMPHANKFVTRKPTGVWGEGGGDDPSTDKWSKDEKFYKSVT